MEHHDPLALANLLWFAGWCVALLVLFVLGIRLPLQPRLARWPGLAYASGSVMLAIALVVLANTALVGRDVYVDLTREQIFTPSRQAVEVVERLRQDVQLTYFYHAQDQQGKRQKDLLEVLGRRNPRLHVRTIDPDKQPSLAKTYGVRLYNAAVLETGGRRMVVQSTDEDEIALGMQRVVRERVVTLCFIAGHNEYPIDNFDFIPISKACTIIAMAMPRRKWWKCPGMALDGCGAPSKRRALTSRLFSQQPSRRFPVTAR